jgi:hypothetical protein
MKGYFYSILIFIAISTLSITQSREFLKFLSDEMPELQKNSNNFQSDVIEASVRYHFQDGTYTVVNTLDIESPAYGTFTKSLEVKGWDTLAISSYQGENMKYSDETKSYAMGYLEGVLTKDRIWTHYQNSKITFFDKTGGKMPDKTREYLQKNLEWMKSQAIEERNTSSYWYHIYTIIRQTEGLVDGYNSVAGSNQYISYEDFQVMNAAGDISEIGYWNPQNRPDFSKMNFQETIDFVEKNSHCSALIKVAADYSDIWFGHNTWTGFSSMTRIFKEYRFKSNKKSEKSLTVAFSSYPGTLSSVDDFYVTDTDLYVTETTNQVFKTDLYDFIRPESLLTWVRTIVANRLADNGKDWTQIFSEFNSGTYNNQFQILDLKLIDTDKKMIQDHALWIVEQIPGQTQSDDVTNILRYGYWPSYNSAYFQKIREISGYDDELKNKPELKDRIDYDGCARANIFRRDQNKINDLSSFKKLIRYNNFQNDPLSKGNPSLAIACRNDLNTTDPDCRGAIDAKVSSIRDIKGQKKKKIYIISGPSADNQIPFDSSKATCNNQNKYKFEGLPQIFNFSWSEYETTLFDN